MGVKIKKSKKKKVTAGMPTGAVFDSNYLNVWALCDLYLRKYPKMQLHELWEKVEPIIRKEFPHSNANLHTLRSYRTRFRGGVFPKTRLPLKTSKEGKGKKK